MLRWRMCEYISDKTQITPAGVYSVQLNNRDYLSYSHINLHTFIYVRDVLTL